MLKRKAGQLRVLPHERLVEVDYGSKKKIQGVVFGQQGNSFYVCLARQELEQAGITGHGPCLNKIFDSSRVRFLEGAKPVVIEEEEEDEDT